MALLPHGIRSPWLPALAASLVLAALAPIKVIAQGQNGPLENSPSPEATSFPPLPNIPFNPPASAQLQSQVFEPSRIVATVGDEHIFKGDLLSEADLILAPALEKMSAADRETQREQIDLERERMAKQLLEVAVSRKLLYLDFLKTIKKNVTDENKRKEIYTRIQKSSDETFDKSLESMRSKIANAKPDELQEILQQDMQMARLALQMKQANLQDDRELDEHLRKYGTSLQQQRLVFMERMVGNEARRKHIDFEPIITHEQMLNYYRDNAKEFVIPARARWEQLTVLFNKFPSKFEAGEAMAKMANEAFFGGSFATVAKRSSQEPNADEGGYHDWVSQGSLKSKPLDQAIFSLPVKEMSRIIEDESGLHVIRVLEREDSRSVPFTEAQVKIKEKLRQEDIRRQLEAYVEKLKKSTPIWNTYDAPAAETASVPRDPLR